MRRVSEAQRGDERLGESRLDEDRLDDDQLSDEEFDALQDARGFSPTRNSRRWLAIGALLAVPVLALIVWLGVGMSKDAIDDAVVGYRVDSDSQVTVTWRAEHPDDKVVVCTVQAQDVRHGVVGSVVETIPAGSGTTTTRTTVVRTTARAVSGNVKECHLG